MSASSLPIFAIGFKYRIRLGPKGWQTERIHYRFRKGLRTIEWSATGRHDFLAHAVCNLALRMLAESGADAMTFDEHLTRIRDTILQALDNPVSG